MKRTRNDSSSSDIQEEEMDEVTGAEFLRRLGDVATSSFDMRSGESLVTIDPVLDKKGRDILRDPTRPRPREDGSLVEDGPRGLMFTPEEERGPLYRENWFQREDTVYNDKRMAFFRLLAGHTNQPVEAMFDATDMRNQAIYDNELKAWNEAERKRIMVGASDKEKQLVVLERRAAALANENRSLEWTRTMLGHLSQDMQVIRALTPRKSTTGREGSVAMCFLFYKQYMLLRGMVKNLAEAKATLQEHVNGIRDFSGKFAMRFSKYGSDRITHTLADGYLVKARSMVRGYVDNKSDSVTTTSYRNLTLFIYNYLFTRDELYPHLLQFEESSLNGTTGMYEGGPIAESFTLSDVFYNTLVESFYLRRLGLALQSIYFRTDNGVRIMDETRAKKQLQLEQERRDLELRNGVLGQPNLDKELQKVQDKINVQKAQDRADENKLLKELRTSPEKDQFDEFLANPARIQTDTKAWVALAPLFTATVNWFKRTVKNKSAKEHMAALRTYTAGATLTRQTYALLLAKHFGSIIQLVLFENFTSVSGSAMYPGLQNDYFLWLYLALCLATNITRTTDKKFTFTIPFQIFKSAIAVMKGYPLVEERVDAFRAEQLTRGPDSETNKIITIVFPDRPSHAEDSGFFAILNNNLLRVDLLELGVNTLFRNHPVILKTTFDSNDIDFYELLTDGENPITLDYITTLNDDVGNTWVSTKGMAFACHVLLPVFLGDLTTGLMVFLRNENASVAVADDNIRLIVQNTVNRELPAGPMDERQAADYLASPIRVMDNIVTLNKITPLLTIDPVVVNNFQGIYHNMNLNVIMSNFVWKQHPSLSLVIYAFAWLQTIAGYLKRELDGRISKLDTTKDKTEAELYRLSQGTSADIEDQRVNVRQLYTPSAEWQFRPEFTGRQRITPEVVAKLDEALQKIRKYVPSLKNATLDALMLSDMDSGLPGAFALFVATLINKTQLTFASTYNKDLQYAMEGRLRQDAMTELHNFRVSESPPYLVQRAGVPTSVPPPLGPSMSVYFF